MADAEQRTPASRLGRRARTRRDAWSSRIRESPAPTARPRAARFDPEADLAGLPRLRGRLRRGRDRRGRLRRPARSRTRSAAASTATTTCSLEHDAADRRRGRAAGRAHLLALPGHALSRTCAQVYSHPQALAQCDRFLRTLTGVEIIATYDTAGSAKLIAERAADRTRRRSPRRARREVFGLDAAASRPSRTSTTTSRASWSSRARARQPARPRIRAPTRRRIVFTLPNEPGALFKALSVFALRDIDLTKLESRPIPGRPWEYLFYVDLAVGRARPALRARARAPRRVRADRCASLGSYPSCQSTPVGETAAPAGGPASRRPASEPHERTPLTDRPEPRAGARHAQGRRLLRRRPAASRSSASPTPGSRSAPATSTCARWPRTSRRASARPAARRWSSTPSRSRDGITMGTEGMQRLARQPRGHRRLDRARRARQPASTALVVLVRLRQDDSRRA